MKNDVVATTPVSGVVTRILDRPAGPLITIVAALAITLMVINLLGNMARRPASALGDFEAFYCGASVARAHHDPYALSPLWACEKAQARLAGDVAADRSGINPDPMPGYDIAVFEPLTLLPYRVAFCAWDAILLAAIVGTAALLAGLTGLPGIVVAAILSFIDGTLIIPNGQLAPVMLFGLALAAYGLVRGRAHCVYVGAAIAMFEPHVGLSAYCAIFVWRPGLRRGLVGVAAILAGISIITLGVPINIEYVQAALPAQAQAESTSEIQYSLAWLLHYFGVAESSAIRIASVQYALFAVTSVLLAGSIARRLDCGAVIALFPPMVALIGGPYVHLNHMAAAIPYALLLVTRVRATAAVLSWAAIALLAVPWPTGSRVATMEYAVIILTVVLVAMRTRRVAAIASVAIMAMLAYGVIADSVITKLVPDAPRHAMGAVPLSMPRARDGDRLASEEDARESRASADFSVSTPRTLARKIPIWLGLWLLTAVSVIMICKPLARLGRRRIATLTTSEPADAYAPIA